MAAPTDGQIPAALLDLLDRATALETRAYRFAAFFRRRVLELEAQNLDLRRQIALLDRGLKFPRLEARRGEH